MPRPPFIRRLTVYWHLLKIDILTFRYILEILDTAGTEQFQMMRELYMKNGDGFVFVYSITSAGSFNDLINIHEDLMRIKEAVSVGLFKLENIFSF